MVDDGTAICISGHPGDLDHGRLEEMGFSHFLPKPFDLKRLRDTVGLALGIEA